MLSTERRQSSPLFIGLFISFPAGEDDCWNTILTELDDLSSPTVSSAAAGALGTIGDPDGITALVRAFNMADDFIVQMSAVVALGTIGDRSILPQLVSWLSRYDPQKVSIVLG